LDDIYKENEYSRFLYGKLFRKIIKHLDDEDKVYAILRYILNKTNKTNKKEDVIKGEVSSPKVVDNYIEKYQEYINNSFDDVLNYITSLFEKNNTSLQKHYEKMKIKNENKHKGFYLHKCRNGESMEEFILKIFLSKIDHLLLSQNILIFSAETSPEEMQAFFSRSILCEYNTLFVVEMNNSFSDYQQKVMYSYIDSLLSYKNKKYNESEKKNIEKNKTNIYLKSCIVFVYDENIKNNSLLDQLGNFGNKEIHLGELDTSEKENEFKNVKVITSDICGLGKSHKIKEMIESDKKQYYHFPLGGLLTKSIISEKLSALLKKIKEKSDKYEKVAIHLDLKESKEICIINEFLLSFLITKFYINNENIIYIPKDIQIYIEIPNTFENYLSKFGILKFFNFENISLDKIPKLDLSKDIVDIFDRILGYKLNEEIEQFIKEKIGTKIYSYYQVQIFINLFISHYDKFEKNLQLDKKDVKEQLLIQEFAESTKYFTSRGFAKMITEKKEDKKKDYIELISKIYENELKDMKFDIPLIFINREKKSYSKLELLNKYTNTKDYLKIMKEVFNLQLLNSYLFDNVK